MNTKLKCKRTASIQRFTLILLFLFLGLSLTPAALEAEIAYVQPDLFETGDYRLSVIVSAVDSASAFRAVESVGGEVTSDLWLIDAVGAQVDRDAIPTLSDFPGVKSIVANRGISTADGPEDGYVSQRRVRRQSQELADTQVVPVAALPDGGGVSLTKNGKLLLLNADGTTRTNLSLPGGHYKTAPIVSPNGTILVTREEKAVYAVSADGQTLWQFDRVDEKFKAGPALGTDGTVYVIDEKRMLYSIDPTTGQEQWRLRVGPDAAGRARYAPSIGPDNTIYVVTEHGYLLAVDPAGSIRWSFIAGEDKPLYPPYFSHEGTIFLANNEKQVYGVDGETGAQRFSYTTGEHIKAAPALGPEDTLYVADEKLNLHALNPDGTLRFLFSAANGDKFISSPVLAPDGTAVYVATEDGWVYAVDTGTGTGIWQYRMQGKVKDSPVVDREGTIVVGSEGHDLVFLSPDGQRTYQTQFNGKISQRPGVNGANDLVVRVDDDQIVTVGRLPNQWDGSPDVQATDDATVYKFANPVTIDVGADVLHEGSAGFPPLTGHDVTVAVVDSGVYFNRDVKEILGGDVEHLFVGQADFVGTGRCEDTSSDYQQYETYCWTNHKTSVDRFGHGSHVAGTIWNHFTDYGTGVNAGIAPGANILSVRVLGNSGTGTYEDVIEGIQFVVENKEALNIRVLNLSLSAQATTPYFVDPLNRAAEAAWAQGIVVVAAAGNAGPAPETVTVPGNDPYIITVGAIDSKRTPGYWADDVIPQWSSTGPTQDGFVKPDVLAPGTNIVSFMYNDPRDSTNSAYLARQHPDYSETATLFRMNGTSMATAVTSGVVALMLESRPQLTPDEAKFRLMATAKSAATPDDEQLFSPLQQGAGRIWAPDAVSSEIPAESANSGMDILGDLGHPWQESDSLNAEDNPDLAYHYLGPVQRLVSDDGQFYLYFVAEEEDGAIDPLGIARLEDGKWLDGQELDAAPPTFHGGEWSWSDHYLWSGGRYSWSGGRYSWSGGRYSWSGGRYSWSGGRYSWSGGRYSWSGGRYSWSGGRYSWSGGRYSWSGGRYSWSGSSPNVSNSYVTATTWVDE